jgi:hypothetical protein
MYNCSSSVKDLAPKQLTRATLLRLTQTQTHIAQQQSGQQLGILTITGYPQFQMT